MFTLAHRSNMALRYLFLLWCGFNVYSRLVIRWCGVGNLAPACVFCICTCKQKYSLLEVISPDWLQMESSCIYISPACHWCTWHILDLEDSDLLWYSLVKWPYLLQFMHCYFLAGHLKPSMGLESPHFEHLSLPCCVWLGWIYFLVRWFLTLVFTWVPLVTLWSRLVGMLFPLAFAWWEVCSLMPQQVHLSWLGVTCNLFDVSIGRFEDSIILASCLTLLAGNFSRCILESLMFLETNSSSFWKNQKISQCKTLAVSGEYWARDSWAWTALYHSSIECLPCLQLVSRSNLALTPLICGLQVLWHILIHSKISTSCYDFLAFYRIR